MRPLRATEFALAFGVLGSLLAVGVPSFLRALSASKLSEPLLGLDRIAAGALSHAARHEGEVRFPPSSPLTPAQVPRGVRVVDGAEDWQHLTWLSLGYAMKEPHAFSFQFERRGGPAEGSGPEGFVARAHGDLDGDGNLSTFELQGEAAPGAPAKLLPGLYVEREVE